MSERRLGNFNSCCRLCLSEKLGTLKSIFEDESRGQEIAKNIKSSLGVQIHSTDKLTTMICNTCSEQVRSWHSFRRGCIENQTTLIRRMNSFFSSNMGNITIQIKDEVVEQDEVPIDVEDDDVVHVKAERVDETEHLEASYEGGEVLDDNSYELPPPLTPHMPDHMVDNDENMMSDDQDDDDDSMSMLVPFVEFSEGDTLLNGELGNHNGDDKTCTICGKHFSTPANRKKHERMVHLRKNNKSFKTLKNILNGMPNNQDISNMGDSSINGMSSNEETEFEKIQFAAELRLQQRSVNLNPVNNSENISSLTSVEVRYLEKAREIVNMADTLTCLCHKKSFPDYKDLFVHLENQRTWFAMLTCYDCLTTFGDKPTYIKHFCMCINSDLESLKRFVKEPVNPEIKLRLYQNFKCVKCNITFAFHEDYCTHFNIKHIEFSEDNVLSCMCSEVFHNVDNFKRHCHLSCFLSHFCDVCFQDFATIEEFRLHCERVHDDADGDTIDSYDTYLKRKFGSVDENEPTNRRSLPPELRQNDDNALSVKRRRTVQLPASKDLGNTARSNMVINPHAIRNLKSSNPSTCPDCGKHYSSYHNMLRHYRIAHDASGKILTCSYCSIKFRLFSELRDHEIAEHSQEADANVEEDVKPQISPEQMNFSCPDCGKLSKTISEWRVHMETHPKKACSECDKQFTLQSELDQHRSVHLNIKVYRDSKTQDYKSTMVSPSSLICKICDKTFTTKNELAEHNLLHESMPILSAQNDLEEPEEKPEIINRKYSCVECNKHYASYGGIWDHNKKHHGGKMTDTEYPKQCTYCEKIISSRCGWVNHLRMHERLLEQPKPTPVETRRMSRSSNNDDGESYYTCKRCFKVFSKKYDYKNHMRSHGINLSANTSNRSSTKTGKVIKTYWCDVCHQACPGYAELQEHKKEHIGKKTPKILPQVINQKQNDFSCTLCNVTLTSNFALIRHMEKHHTNKDSKSVSVYCKFCKIPFQDMDEFNDHMEKEHEKAQIKQIKQTNNDKNTGKRFTCTVCKKSFDNASALASHQGWHKRGKFGKKVLNPKAKGNSRIITLPPQISISNPYPCRSCPKTFVNETALQIHILETHRNINATLLSMNCNNCKISFDSKAAFDRHMQLHEVVESQRQLKPYPCQYCNAGFTRSDTLNAHVKQHHKEFYNDIFKCTFCERVFDKQNALTIHLKTHDRQRLSGEMASKPSGSKNVYFCSICKLGFAIAKDLRHHVVTAHPF